MPQENSNINFPGAELLPADVGVLEERIGHRFTDRRLLLEALTHSSFQTSTAASVCPATSGLSSSATRCFP